MPEKQDLTDRNVLGTLERDGTPVVTDDGQIMGYVNHGSDPNVPRPNVAGAVTWVGTVDPVNRITGDILLNPSEIIHSPHLSQDATIDNVDAVALVTMPDNAVNGFVVKSSAGADAGYGQGQAFLVLEDGAGNAADSSPAGSVMFRVDRRGNLGTTGGIHVATGLRNDDGQTQAVWIDPADNMIPLVITNPDTTEAATWDKDFILIQDARNANEQLFRVTSVGNLLSRRNISAYDGDAKRTQIGDTFGFAGVIMGNAADTLIWRDSASVVAIHNVIQMAERADAAAPAADRARMYVRDNGAGKTQLVVRFNTGAIQVIATQP